MALNIKGLSISSPTGTTFQAGSLLNVNAAGIITRPNTPYMRGQISGRGTIYNAGNGGYMLIVPDENIGNCYNPANGLWTCPVAGHYIMMGSSIATGTAQGVQGSGYVYIYKNGANYAFTHWNFTSSWHYVSISAVVAASAGDTMGWVLSAGTGGWHGNGNHHCFAIGLLM